MRPPPRSPLFPTRRSSDLYSAEHAKRSANIACIIGIKSRVGGEDVRCAAAATRRVVYSISDRPELRSEEHTSELQSRLHLVCRLLLEKKKTYKSDNTTQND